MPRGGIAGVPDPGRELSRPVRPSVSFAGTQTVLCVVPGPYTGGATPAQASRDPGVLDHVRNVAQRRGIDWDPVATINRYSRYMHSPADVIQVQLVTDEWSTSLPIVAIAVSLFSVALTLVFRYRDRLRLSAPANWAFPVGRGGDAVGAALIYVMVTNESRTATTQVSQLALELPDGRTFARTERWPADDVLPADLGPGANVRISYQARGLGMSLLNEHVSASWIRARAVCGHRRTVGRKQRKLADALRTRTIERSPQLHIASHCTQVMS